MPSPRILQIGKHFHPDRGGIETVTRNISDGLATAGIEADVLCTALHATGDRQEQGYRVIRSPSNAIVAGNKTLSFDYVRQVARLSSQYDVGLLHVPNPVGAAAVLAGWRKPLIVLWHADFNHKVFGLLTHPLDMLVARRAAVVVAPTSVHLSCSNRARHLLPRGEIIPFPLAPLPAPDGAPAPVADRVRAAAGGRRMVLAIGRLVPYKGFGVLIRAMAMADPSLYSVIAGDGPLRATLEREIADAGVADRVMLTGPVGDADMAALVDLAWLGCLPSITAQEMYGLTQVEMMAAGKPMVSTDIPGSGVPLVNRHDETGLLARPGDATDLARQLTALARDEALYRRLAMGAGHAYQHEHSLPTVGKRYAALIRRLVQR